MVTSISRTACLADEFQRTCIIMGRYSSDSDDGRRKKHKSSRKRDKRSRSRERRKRSRSRDRKQSHSRSSSYDDYRRSRSSRKDRRYSRSSSSRSSSYSSDDERRRSRKDKKSSTSSSQVSKEQTKKKMKRALAKAESKDEVLQRDKATKEQRKLAPDKEALLRIESNEFVPQSFSSSAGNKGEQVGGKNIDGSHEEAMFGTGGSVTDTVTLTSAPEVKTTSQPVIPQSAYKEGLFASWLHEDEETKTARWITKLKKMRQELLAAT